MLARLYEVTYVEYMNALPSVFSFAMNVDGDKGSAGFALPGVVGKSEAEVLPVTYACPVASTAMPSTSVLCWNESPVVPVTKVEYASAVPAWFSLETKPICVPLTAVRSKAPAVVG